MSADFYRTINKPSTAEFKDRGSRFIAFVYPIHTMDEFKNYRARLKKEHPKASHHCFAYRLGTDGINFRVSDDGEPSGSAGRPILGQIDGCGLTNVLIVVVRYFGGTLLGVPGLIHAYKTSAALALEQSAIIQKPVLVFYRLQFDYMLVHNVMKLVKQYDCEISKQELQLFCIVEAGIPKNKQQEMLEKLKDIKGLEITGF
ncbi:IMPACT family protein [Parafilimonas sp.]|uniref:IMPACT family protein n=1 Tax=Parafilimonas sp. TaxID=1969739 RepID=UPI0039E50ABF